MKKPLIAVAIALVIMLDIYLYRLGKEDDQVTLRKPNGDIVQMFERFGIGDEGKVTHFPNRTACTKLDGPIAVDFGGSDVLYVYKLTCNGTTGYVNVRWVSLY